MAAEESKPKLLICRQCGQEFARIGHLRLFCERCKDIGVCQQCGREFATKTHQSSHCPDCRKKHREWDWGARVCARCGSKFLARTSNHKYCCTKKERRRPVGCYVYAWFRDGEALPFYIGKGTGERANAVHFGVTGALALCEVVRRQAQSVSVKIIRDNLTIPGADLLESTIIHFVKQCGGRLANLRGGAWEQEEPPLVAEA
jgi:hypothetical protein